jgi:Uma2 family endonuclease
MALVLHPTQERVILHGLSWETFERLLIDRGDRPGVLFAYDQGTVELTMPSAEHEMLKQFLVLIVDAIAFARDLHLLNVGSTTFTRADLARGFEPDACFYIQHVDAMQHPERIDLPIDPPPDLVIEIDITSPSLNKLPIYAIIGVPEVWRYSREGITLYQRRQDTYEPVEGSAVLSGITRHDLLRFLTMARIMSNRTAWFKAVAAAVQARDQEAHPTV